MMCPLKYKGCAVNDSVQKLDLATSSSLNKQYFIEYLKKNKPQKKSWMNFCEIDASVPKKRINLPGRYDQIDQNCFAGTRILELKLLYQIRQMRA